MCPRPSSFFTDWQTSKPFFLGIMTSRKTRLGCSAWMVSSASSRLEAVNNSTPSSSSSSSVCWINIRKCGSSSTIRIFMWLLINEEQNVLEAFFKTERAYSLVTRKQRVQNDDVGFGGN